MANVRKAQEFIVTRNGRIVPELQILQVQNSLGGNRLDYARLVYDGSRVAGFKSLDDFSPFVDLGDLIVIRAVGGPQIHQGRVTQVLPQFSPGTAQVGIVSQLTRADFGKKLFGRLTWNPHIRGFIVTADDLVFNPRIDGINTGNKHATRTFNAGVARQQIPIFVDPESVRTAQGIQLHGGSGVPWLLSEVIYYLIWRANPTAGVFRNPTLQQLAQVVRDSVDIVRSLRVKAGSSLPEALDAILPPLGYLWGVDHNAGRFIDIIRKSSGGRVVALKHQREKQVVDTDKTNTKSLGVRFDSGRTANVIIGRGSKLQVEFTSQLHRAWPASKDDTPSEELKKKAVLESEDADLRNTWRKWVLNEAGDYINLRSEIKDPYHSDFLSAINQEGFGKYFSPRRRKLLPMLTLNEAGTDPLGSVQGIEVEWKQADDTWAPAGNWGIKLLQREAGIYIGADDIPEELIDQGENAALRVTATIEADVALTYIAPKLANSPLNIEAEEFLDFSDQFHWRVLLTGSKYASGTNSAAVNDLGRLTAFCNSLRERFDQLDVPGGVVLEGVDQLAYKIGDRVSGIAGKNISFAAKRGTQNYPQIAALTYDVQGQHTIVQLQRFREFIA